MATLTPSELQRDAKFGVKCVTFTSRPSCWRSRFPLPVEQLTDLLISCNSRHLCVLSRWCVWSVFSAELHVVPHVHVTSAVHALVSVYRPSNAANDFIFSSCVVNADCGDVFSAPSQFCFLITGMSIAHRQAVLKIISFKCRINSYLKISQRETKQILGINRSTASHCQRHCWRALTHSVKD